MILFIDFISVIFSISFLAFSSWSDFKNREVSDKIWILFAPIAIALTSARIYLSTDILMISILSILSISFISVISFHVGMMGGADTKALICIALAMPIYPSFLSGFIQPIFPLAVMMNSFIIGSLISLFAILRNLHWLLFRKEELFDFKGEPLWKKMLAFISGYKIAFNDLKIKQHFYPIEEIEIKEGIMYKRIKPLIFLEDYETDSFNIIKKYSKIKSKYIWVTPLLPMLVFITLGYLLTLIVNDAILKFIFGLF